LTAEGRTYFGFGTDDRFVLASRLKLGSIVGAEIAELPSDELFFAGGGGSVRGYAYRNIGVNARRNGDNYVIGGRSLVEGSVE
ncbi:BamA/TamA family outer membrane protein, partial [Pseudoxanthomonas sp. KAs_5_3]